MASRRKVFAARLAACSLIGSLTTSCVPRDQTTASSPQGALPNPGAPTPAPPGGNLLKTSNFDEGKSLPWMPSFTTPGSGAVGIQNGAYCLNVQNKGANPWDAQVRHREMVIQKGHTYSVQFKAYSSTPTKIRAKIGMAGPPYKEYWTQTVDLSPSPQTIAGTFTMQNDDDATAEFAIHAGGPLASPAGAFSICLDDIFLTDPDFKPAQEAKAAPIPAVRVNELGYLPHRRKLAVVVHSSNSPEAFTVSDAKGNKAFEGKTILFGKDPDSGDSVQLADFSALQTPGTGYVLRVGNDSSYPFDIRPDLYKTLKYDALAYFYHNRSGIPIEMPYARDARWARPAGHLGDKHIACAPKSGCNYSLDVSGGWYDAGDHGKYVVNGGISVWTLLNEYERAQHAGTAGSFADGKLAIPESHNGVPDLLDEARWELEFLLKMQVPEGQPKAGMAHHKIHDEAWTALATPPAEAEKKVKRYLRPPSTAATLNLAAVAAQCARVYKTVDAAFAARCKKAAERAWTAARQNPSVFAPKSDSVGGGPYDDTNVSDEFYWAAAELFITTGSQVYRDFVLASPHHAAIELHPGGDSGGAAAAMTWQSTAALGTISLALVPSALGQSGMDAERKKVIAAADQFVGFASHQGYRIPMKSDEGYPWGSNSVVMNNLIVEALAYDFTKNAKYLDSVVEGMDYILGKNPLAKSYVTGYGENPLQNPHHRFWSHQANPALPSPPPGAVSGGPNSALQDPYAQAAGIKGSPPQKCYLDNIESWSTNEITINWNAPLAWLTAFIDELGA